MSFLENSDASDLGSETLEQQYELVKKRTSQDGTYRMGSHVTQFGATTFLNDPVDEYIGDGRSGAGFNGALATAEAATTEAMSQRDAFIHHLWMAYVHADAADKDAAKAAFDKESNHRAAVDAAVLKVAEAAVRAGAGLSGDKAKAEAKRLVEHVGADDKPITKDWDCFKAGIDAFHESCVAPTKSEHSQYWFKFTRTFANLCDAGFGAPALRTAAARACGTATAEA